MAAVEVSQECQLFHRKSNKEHKELRAQMLTNLIEECSMLREIVHPNITPFFGLFFYSPRDKGAPSMTVILTELVNETLRARTRREPRLTMHDVVDAALEIASALQYLDKHKGFKRKGLLLLNSMSVTYNQCGVCKIGLSRMSLLNCMPGSWKISGSEHYFPAEVLLRHDFDQEDTISNAVFSLGVLIIEMSVGSIPRPHPIHKSPCAESRWLDGNSTALLGKTEIERRKEDLDRLSHNLPLLPLIQDFLNLKKHSSFPTLMEFVVEALGIFQQHSEYERSSRIQVIDLELSLRKMSDHVSTIQNRHMELEKAILNTTHQLLGPSRESTSLMNTLPADKRSISPWSEPIVAQRSLATAEAQPSSNATPPVSMPQQPSSARTNPTTPEDSAKEASDHAGSSAYSSSKMPLLCPSYKSALCGSGSECSKSTSLQQPDQATPKSILSRSTPSADVCKCSAPPPKTSKDELLSISLPSKSSGGPTSIAARSHVSSNEGLLALSQTPEHSAPVKAKPPEASIAKIPDQECSCGGVKLSPQVAKALSSERSDGGLRSSQNTSFLLPSVISAAPGAEPKSKEPASLPQRLQPAAINTSSTQRTSPKNSSAHSLNKSVTRESNSETTKVTKPPALDQPATKSTTPKTTLWSDRMSSPELAPLPTSLAEQNQKLVRENATLRALDQPATKSTTPKTTLWSDRMSSPELAPLPTSLAEQNEKLVRENATLQKELSRIRTEVENVRGGLSTVHRSMRAVDERLNKESKQLKDLCRRQGHLEGANKNDRKFQHNQAVFQEQCGTEMKNCRRLLEQVSAAQKQLREETSANTSALGKMNDSLKRLEGNLQESRKKQKEFASLLKDTQNKLEGSTKETRALDASVLLVKNRLDELDQRIETEKEERLSDRKAAYEGMKAMTDAVDIVQTTSSIATRDSINTSQSILERKLKELHDNMAEKQTNLENRTEVLSELLLGKMEPSLRNGPLGSFLQRFMSDGSLKDVHGDQDQSQPEKHNDSVCTCSPLEIGRFAIPNQGESIACEKSQKSEEEMVDSSATTPEYFLVKTERLPDQPDEQLEVVCDKTPPVRSVSFVLRTMK